MESQESKQLPSSDVPHLASAGRADANEHQEQPDLFATELGNLDTLLTLDDDVTRPERSFENHHNGKGFGRAQNFRKLVTRDDSPLTPHNNWTPAFSEEGDQGRRERERALTPQDWTPSFSEDGDHHIRPEREPSFTTLVTVPDDTWTPANRSPDTHLEEKGQTQGRPNSTAPRDPLLRHISGTGVEFKDLWYTVVAKQKKDGKWIKREAHLLQGITGVASKGEITAVLGSSGAGKSTLLDALAGRIASGSLKGTTTVDGRLVTPTLMKRMSAYVMQDDQLFPLLTVWETLWFAAEVRLPRSVSHEEKRDRVTKLLDQLGLTTARSTYIGDEKTRGISGGEKRRVSIGVDIIHGPALLFMDEPTSGLDSGNAFNVIEKVHGIAKEGSTVILTIHQPSFRILRFVNRLIVLARGQLIYQGGPSNLSQHLAGFGRQVPRAENPMEYLLDVIQEYDDSAHGIAPLVLYNNDGTKPEDNELLRTPVRGKRPPVGADTQKRQSLAQDRSTISEISLKLSKMASPFRHQNKSKTPDHTFETMEAGYGQYLDMDDNYDHSINRAPQLASNYYQGLLTDLADRFMTPILTPSASPRTTPRMGATPSPWRTSNLSPMQPNNRTMPKLSPKQLLQRKLSTTPLRSPSELPQVQQTQERSYYEMETSTVSKQASTESTVSEKDYNLPETLHDEKFANIWWREVVILMLRNLKNFQRAPEHFLSRQITVTFMGVLLATLFLKVRRHLSDLDGVNSIMSFFIFTVTVFFFSSNDAVPAFIMERLIFIRETSHNAYRASSYVAANAIVSVPFLAIQAMTFALITWWALGFEHTGMEAFFFFFLILFISLLCASSFVMFVSSVVPNYVLGYVVVVGFTSFYFLMCGFFIQRTQIPPYWIWVHYISTLKYPYEAMMINEFGNPNPKYQVCYFRDSSGQCSLSGQDLLKKLGITQLTKWESLAILCAMAVFYRFLFYCVLRFGTKNQRS